MLMIAMMMVIEMMINMMPKSFMVMLQDLMMLMMITMIMMIIMIMDLMPGNFMVILQDLMILIIMMEFDSIRFHGVSKIYEGVPHYSHCRDKYKGTAHSSSNFRCKIQNKVPVVFHNASSYGYHFIIKQLVEQFKEQFKCFGEIAKKYTIFSVEIENQEHGKTINKNVRELSWMSHNASFCSFF